MHKYYKKIIALDDFKQQSIIIIEDSNDLPRYLFTLNNKLKVYFLAQILIRTQVWNNKSEI